MHIYTFYVFVLLQKNLDFKFLLLYYIVKKNITANCLYKVPHAQTNLLAISSGHTPFNSFRIHFNFLSKISCVYLFAFYLFFHILSLKPIALSFDCLFK